MKYDNETVIRIELELNEVVELYEFIDSKKTNSGLIKKLREELLETVDSYDLWEQK